MTRTVHDAAAYVAVQSLPSGRTFKVPVAQKRNHFISVTAAIEAAFFPRFFWMTWGAFVRGDGDFQWTLRALREDVSVYVRIILPSQYPDFVGKLEDATGAAMEPLLGRAPGPSGGLGGILVLMTGFLLVKWVDRHAPQAIFTNDFAGAAQDILTHLDQLYGADCDDVMAQAYRTLPQVIARLKSCGLFTWLPDYRGEDHDG